MEYHKSTSMVPLMHFKCKTDEKGRIIKNYANRFWSVIENDVTVWIGAFVIFWKFLFSRSHVFLHFSHRNHHADDERSNTVKYMQPGTWMCILNHWKKKDLYNQIQNCILYLKHPNFLLYYIQAWIEIVNVVASLSLAKFHVFIHFIAIIASQKNPTHEFDKKRNKCWTCTNYDKIRYQSSVFNHYVMTHRIYAK